MEGMPFFLGRMQQVLPCFFALWLQIFYNLLPGALLLQLLANGSSVRRKETTNPPASSWTMERVFFALGAQNGFRFHCTPIA